MTPEEKQILLKDLCARLPYETWVQYEGKEWLVTGYGHGRVSLLPSIVSSVGGPCPLIEEVKPYLRPMSSMTEKEEKTFQAFLDFQAEYVSDADLDNKTDMFDWLISHHFDFRSLIEKGLALEALEGIYK